MTQINTFPLTILLMKDGKLKVVSLLSTHLTIPLLKRVIQELEVSYEDRYYAPETELEEDGRPNHLFQTFQDTNADAICLLTDDGEFIFILSPVYEIPEIRNYQHLMREKLIQYIPTKCLLSPLDAFLFLLIVWRLDKMLIKRPGERNNIVLSNRV